ncbi:MAG: universal stress protein [Acidobacteria bacterium]|nr:universal stress protein [Acidobacteriota bacterium]
MSHLTDLTGPTGDHEDFDRLLVAVDGSEHSDRAVAVAADLASAYDASLTILNVAATPVVPIVTAPLLYTDSWGSGWVALADSGEQIVAATERLALRTGPIDITTAVVTGHPSSMIVDHASRVDADVICIGRRGLGNVRGLLVGSVSHAVGHLASQTVVTVR